MRNCYVNYVSSFCIFNLINAELAMGETIQILPEGPGQFEGEKSDTSTPLKAARKAVESPSEFQINEENILLKSQMSSASHVGALKKSRTASVSMYGGANGFSRVRLRGTRAFEPQFFFDGMPLYELGNFGQYLGLIPGYLVSKYRIFPDVSPFYYTPRGIGGAIDLQSCSPYFCDFPQFQMRGLATAGSYGYQKFGADLIQNKKGQYFFHPALEISQSKENFPYLNNNNTLSRSDDDFVTNRKNNDFQKKSAGFVLQIYNVPHVGHIDFSVLGGLEKRGFPGMTSSPLDSRMRQNLFITQAKSSTFWPNSGFEMQTQWAHSQNAVAVNSEKNPFFVETVEQKSKFYYFKTKFSVPSLSDYNGTSAWQISNSLAQIDSRVKKNQGSLELFESKQAQNHSMVLSGHQDLVISFDSEHKISFTVEGGGDTGFLKGAPISVLPFANASAQFSNQLMAPFVRISQESRRPALHELEGGPRGLLANASLRPETSQKLELGIFSELLNITWYGAQDEYLIFLQSAGGQAMQYNNLEFGKRTGVDISTDISLFDLLNMSVVYHWLNAHSFDLEGRKNWVPRSPEHIFETHFNSKLLTLGSDHSVNVNCGVLYQSSFYLDRANSILLKTKPTLDMSIQWRIKNLKTIKEIALNLEANNLTGSTNASQSDIAGNKASVDHIGFPGFPEPGRRFYITLEGTL